MHFTSTPNPADEDHQGGFFDVVENAVIPDADAENRALRRAYFHSQIFASVLPCSSTSYSKIAATLFRRDHSGEGLW